MNIITAGGISKLTGAERIDNSLPTATYDLQVDPRTGELVLHRRPPFSMPEKIYGGCDAFADRVLDTFKKYPKGMAVLLSGPKGSGKTLTAKRISNAADMPVICVGAAFGGPQFVELLTEIPNKAVIFIDEFEKIYHEEDARNSFLSILDGAADNKHLFLLTSNKEYIGEYFANRAGRVRYHRRYGSLPKDILYAMVDDKMDPDTAANKAVKELIDDMGDISPDALSSIITECIMHNEVPSDFMDFFNVEDEPNGYYTAEIEATAYRIRSGQKLTKEQIQEAQNFIDEYAEYGYDYAHEAYPQGERMCETIKDKWIHECTKAIQRKFDTTKSAGGYFLNISCADKVGNGKKYRSFGYREQDIASVNKKNGIVTVEAKDGTIIKLTPTKAPRYAYGSHCDDW